MFIQSEFCASEVDRGGLFHVRPGLLKSNKAWRDLEKPSGADDELAMVVSDSDQEESGHDQGDEELRRLTARHGDNDAVYWNPSRLAFGASHRDGGRKFFTVRYKKRAVGPASELAEYNLQRDRATTYAETGIVEPTSDLDDTPDHNSSSVSVSASLSGGGARGTCPFSRRVVKRSKYYAGGNRSLD